MVKDLFFKWICYKVNENSHETKKEKHSKIEKNNPTHQNNPQKESRHYTNIGEVAVQRGIV